MMTAPAPASVFWNRPDTAFGVCEALGQDIGISPNWFRAAFGAAILFQPVAVVVVYVALGLGVLASRLLFPPRARIDAPADAPVVPIAARGPASNDAMPELAEAA